MAENYFGITDTGKMRSNNEDTFIAQKLDKHPYILAAVIDGVGGYHGGEVAAAIAQEQITEQMNKAGNEFVPAMVRAVRLASQNIFTRRQQDKQLDSMACVATVSLVDMESNQFYYAHVGDTRLYLLRDNSLVKISKDHSFVGFLEDSGRLTETEAMNHPKRNEINKALGFNSQIETDDDYIETGQSPFLPGDMLLLCSDGLSDMVDKNHMTAILTQNISLEQKAAELVEVANANGGKDNITVVLVQNDKKPQKFGATMPATDSKKRDTILNELAKQEYQSTEDMVLMPAPAVGKKSNLLSILLSVLCLVLLAAVTWLFLERKKYAGTNKPLTDTVKQSRNTQEIKLQTMIDTFTGDTLVLQDTAFKQPLVLSTALNIRKDSLYIKAAGNLVITSDSSFAGPAMELDTGCKFTVLDRLHFKNFRMAVTLYNTPLLLKNVRFTDCRLPVQNNYVFKGNLPVTSFLPFQKNLNDTAAKTTIKINGAR